MKILSAKVYSKKLKATIQQTGRLGFTEETADELKLSDNVAIVFSQSDEDELFLAVTDRKNEDAFRVNLSGKYYYLSTKALFDSLGMDYRNETIIFDLAREPKYDEELNGKTYKITVRRKKRKEKDNEVQLM